LSGAYFRYSFCSADCQRSAWADLLLQIDTYTGMLLDAIGDLGIRDNTIFVFTAANGLEATHHGNNSATIETSFHGSAGSRTTDIDIDFDDIFDQLETTFIHAHRKQAIYENQKKVREGAFLYEHSPIFANHFVFHWFRFFEQSNTCG
jgi:arylsulfatase A-like enzyme